MGFTHDFTGKNMFTLCSLNALSYHNSIAILVGSIAKRHLICDYFEGFLVARDRFEYRFKISGLGQSYEPVFKTIRKNELKMKFHYVE